MDDNDFRAPTCTRRRRTHTLGALVGAAALLSVGAPFAGATAATLPSARLAVSSAPSLLDAHAGMTAAASSRAVPAGAKHLSAGGDFKAAVGALRPGDTLVVAGGTYHGFTGLSAHGTADHRITVMAAPGSRPVVEGLFWATLDYVTLDGINVTWKSGTSSSSHMMKMKGGTGWRLTNGEVWGAHSYAALLISGSPSQYQVDHMYFHDTYKSNDTNQDHLIYVNGGMGGGLITRNLFAHSHNGRGLKIGPPSGSSAKIGNVEVSYNTFLDNLGPSNVQLSYGASGNRIHHNIFVKSGSYSVTAYNLNGSDNAAWDNIGFESRGVIQSGITDRGGNKMMNPGLQADMRPSVSAAQAYGRYAA